MRSIVQIALAFAAAAGLAGVAHAGSTVGAEKMDVVSEKSAHIVVPTAPDVAKTPSPGGPVPIPYPNMGQQTDKDPGKKAPRSTVLKNKSHFKQSTGDEAGTVKEVVSDKNKGKVELKRGGPTVKIEGSPAILLTPIEQNTAPDAAARQTPKTDFGSVLGQGVSKAADVVLGKKKPEQPFEPVKQPVVVAPKNPVDAPPQPLPVKLGPPVTIAPPPQVTPPVAAPPVPIPVPVTPPVNVPQPVTLQPQPVLRR